MYSRNEPEPLQGSALPAAKLFASWLKDVTTRAYVYSLDGKLENEIILPGLGTAGGFGGLNDDKFVFYSFTSFNYPTDDLQIRHRDEEVTVFRTVDIPGFKPRTMKPSRSSTTAKTARACRCSSSTRKA